MKQLENETPGLHLSRETEQILTTVERQSAGEATPGLVKPLTNQIFIENVCRLSHNRLWEFAEVTYIIHELKQCLPGHTPGLHILGSENMDVRAWKYDHLSYNHRQKAKIGRAHV